MIFKKVEDNSLMIGDIIFRYGDKYVEWFYRLSRFKIDYSHVSIVTECKDGRLHISEFGKNYNYRKIDICNLPKKYQTFRLYDNYSQPYYQFKNRQEKLKFFESTFEFKTYSLMKILLMFIDIMFRTKHRWFSNRMDGITCTTFVSELIYYTADGFMINNIPYWCCRSEDFYMEFNNEENRT